jgi:hypothetical protein
MKGNQMDILKEITEAAERKGVTLPKGMCVEEWVAEKCDMLIDHLEESYKVARTQYPQLEAIFETEIKRCPEPTDRGLLLLWEIKVRHTRIDEYHSFWWDSNEYEYVYESIEGLGINRVELGRGGGLDSAIHCLACAIVRSILY